MKNAISYYYDIFIENLIKDDKGYYFYFNNEEYHVFHFDRPVEDIKSLYNLNLEMKKRKILVHEIILNKNNEILTSIEGVLYVLIKLCNYKNDEVFVNDIDYIQKSTFNINYDPDLLRIDWVNLWCNKIDYYEYQISQLGKKYPILCDSLSYYIGLGENAISYLKNNTIKYKDLSSDYKLTVSHKRVDVEKGSFQFYNPLNFVIDSRIRDLAEYIKNRFFHDKLNFYEIKLYIDSANLSQFEYILLFSRLLFPTYYFDIYDEIINNNLKEDIIVNVIEKSEKYESFILEVYNYIVYEKKFFIEPIDWLNKKL